MGQKHSGWSRTFSGERASSATSGREGYCPTPDLRPLDLTPEQLKQAIAASDRGSNQFTAFVASLPHSEE